MDPNQLDKYLYIRKTPTWFVRLIYSLGIVAWILVFSAYVHIVKVDMFYRYLIAPILAILTIYYLSSYVLNLFYVRPDLRKHHALVKDFWKNNVEPAVDVFLPICGEDENVLHNTWKHVATLAYTNKTIYVLDDSRSDCALHEEMAKSYGFSYIERPSKGEMKKAGNMKYAHERTSGDFILVLDGDFAPHPDFLKETIPYMNDPRVGIVQTPQYFFTTNEVAKKTPLAYGAARAQEIFYRIIQVARDRLDGAHCCGTCAIYRRAALESIGGFVQMAHSEDAHTGFEMTSKGWIVRYIPIILSVGLCPDNPYAFFHQQHRWCLGNVVMILDPKFWKAHILSRVKFCYLVGFLYNINFPLALLISTQLFWMLFRYNPHITLNGAQLFYPYLSFTAFCLFLLPLSRFRIGCIYSDFLKIYSNTHAIFSVIFKQSVAWIPTNAKHTNISAAFQQVLWAVALYLFAYIVLIAFALRYNFIHLFNYNYYSVQFWLFYNGVFSSILLWQMYKTVEDARFKNGTAHESLVRWQLRTAGTYIFGVLTAFFTIVYL